MRAQVVRDAKHTRRKAREQCVSDAALGRRRGITETPVLSKNHTHWSPQTSQRSVNKWRVVMTVNYGSLMLRSDSGYLMTDRWREAWAAAQRSHGDPSTC